MLKFWTKFISSLVRTLALLFIGFYRSFATAWLGGACRFEPSCSDYSAQAFQKFSPGQAFLLSLKRISRCRPGGGCGYDPLPCRGHHGQSEQ